MKLATREDFPMRNKNNRKIGQFNFQKQSRTAVATATKYVEEIKLLGKDTAATNDIIPTITRRCI